MKPYPALFETFMIRNASGWRPPRLNETCYARPILAATLERIAQQGPDAVYTGFAGQVLLMQALFLNFVPVGVVYARATGS